MKYIIEKEKLHSHIPIFHNLSQREFVSLCLSKEIVSLKIT